MGAREDLIKAALLDEEDAEDRCQRRMQRNNEKRMLSTSEENTGRVKKSEEVPPQVRRIYTQRVPTLMRAERKAAKL